MENQLLLLIHYIPLSFVVFVFTVRGRVGLSEGTLRTPQRLVIQRSPAVATTPTRIYVHPSKKLLSGCIPDPC